MCEEIMIAHLLCSLQFLSKPLFWIVVGVVLVLLFLLFLRTSRGKGMVGEWKVRRKLKRSSHGKTYLFNGYINLDERYVGSKRGDRKTAEIDHILVSEKGVIVVETKNYSGQLFGSDEGNEWTQVLAGGKVKNKLYNPVKQNETHCAHVKRIIGGAAPVLSLVVLVQNNTEKLSCRAAVIGLADLKEYLNALPNVIKRKTVVHVAKMLKEANSSKKISHRKHTKNVKRRSRDVKRGVCPSCGAKLVRRKGPYGEFLGCKNYPKCKFKVNVNKETE